MNDKYKFSVLDSNLGKIYTVASKNGLSKILIGESCFKSFISDNVCVKAENDGFIDSIMIELNYEYAKLIPSRIKDVLRRYEK